MFAYHTDSGVSFGGFGSQGWNYEMWNARIECNEYMYTIGDIRKNRKLFKLKGMDT